MLRAAFVQILMATVVSTLIILVAMPHETLVWSLGSMLPIIAIIAFWKWRRYQQSLEGPENVWLDEAGLHWHAGDRAQSLSRSDVTTFRIGIEPDTIRQVPALTLLLQDDFESQPFELHEPASPETVREYLNEQWRIAEQSGSAAGESQLVYDHAIDLYSECHSENYEWHLEGSAAAFAEFASLLETAAPQLPLPPPGAKPRGIILLARRGQPSYLHVQHAQAPRIDHDLLSGPADFLAQFAGNLRAQLPTATGQDGQFDFSVPGRGKWTFHLHQR